MGLKTGLYGVWQKKKCFCEKMKFKELDLECDTQHKLYPLLVASRVLSISTANVEVDFDSYCSIVTEQDSRYVDIPTYVVHKVSVLKTTLGAVFSKTKSIEKRKGAYFRRTTDRINYF